MPIMRDTNGNPVIVSVDQMLQRIFDMFSDSIRVNTGGVGAQAVTPSDSTDLPKGTTKGLYLGGAGNVVVDMADGSTVTLTGLTAGVIHPLSVKRVHATSTTAINIVAIY